MEQLTFGDAPAAAARPDAAVTGYVIERELAAAGSARVAGVDEVGRGAWAGPVVVCAVIARTGFPAPPDGLTDSKRLTARRRAQLAAELPAWVECYAIGEASHEEIDALGMTAALRRAAVRALDGLASPPPGAVAFRTNLGAVRGTHVPHNAEQPARDRVCLSERREEPMTQRRNAVTRFDQVLDICQMTIWALAFVNIEKAAKYYGVNLSETNWRELRQSPQSASVRGCGQGRKNQKAAQRGKP